MKLTTPELSLIAVALTWRMEACEESNELFEARQWRAILRKVGDEISRRAVEDGRPRRRPKGERR